MIKPICRNLQILAQKARPATKQDIPLAKDLLETLAANSADCVGMAANMIGIHKRIIIFSTGMLDVVMVNPKITEKSGAFQTSEGCLSLTGERKCRRYEKITVEYLDSRFEPKTGHFSGFTAQIIQHECDHLDGVII